MSSLRLHMHEMAQAASVLKHHFACRFGEKRMVRAQAHVQSRFDSRSPLTHNDGPARDELTGESFDPQPLGLAVAPVSGTSDSLFVCHASPLDSDCKVPARRTRQLRSHRNFVDANIRVLLAVSPRPFELLLFLVFEDEHGIALARPFDRALH